MKLTPAERQARSERARRQHAAGKLGQRAKDCKYAQVLPTNASAPESASALAQSILLENADEARRVARSALTSGTTASRMKALDTLMTAALRGERAQASDARAKRETRSREELIAAIRQKLESGPAAHVLRAQLEAQAAPVVDAEVVAED